MKTLRFLPALLACFFLFSCSEDNEDTTAPIDQDNLIGTWDMVSLEVTTDFDGVLFDLPLTSNTTTVGENMDYTVTFTETTYSTEGTYDLVTTGTANGEPLEVDRETITDAAETGTYELVDGELVIDGTLVDVEEVNAELEGVEIDPTISTSFNANGDLVIDQSNEISVDTEGGPLNIAYDSRIVLRKQ